MSLNLKQELKDDNKYYNRTENTSVIEQESKQIITTIRNVGLDSFPIVNPIKEAFMKRYGEGFPSHLSFDDILKLLKNNKIYLGVYYSKNLSDIIFIFTVESLHGYDFDYYDTYKTSKDKQLIKSIARTMLAIGFSKMSSAFKNIFDWIYSCNEEVEESEYNYYLKTLNKAYFLFEKTTPAKIKSKYIMKHIREKKEHAKALEYLMEAFILAKDNSINVGYPGYQSNISINYIFEFTEFYTYDDSEYSPYDNELGEIAIIPKDKSSDIIKEINETRKILELINKFYLNFKQ